jgi:hypothetical protein
MGFAAATGHQQGRAGEQRPPNVEEGHGWGSGRSGERGNNRSKIRSHKGF